MTTCASYLSIFCPCKESSKTALKLQQKVSGAIAIASFVLFFLGIAADQAIQDFDIGCETWAAAAFCFCVCLASLAYEERAKCLLNKPDVVPLIPVNPRRPNEQPGYMTV